MKTVVFRSDASIEMGIGHTMRNLTIANLLLERGIKTHFITKSHPGHKMELLKAQGHQVHALSEPDNTYKTTDTMMHADWLRCSWEQDAKETKSILQKIKTDWLIVDHYALDTRWHYAMRPYTAKIMVVDDLHNRQYDCDLLLDHNYGSTSAMYSGLVPETCTVLAGSTYVLIRPEFEKLRAESLSRRKKQKDLEHILIAMGGADSNNTTNKILQAIPFHNLPDNCKISIVLGSTAPFLKEVQKTAGSLPRQTKVHINASNMAELMASSDAAIGAAGGTTWERCCMGLPTAIGVFADNQHDIADRLAKEGCVMNLGSLITTSPDILREKLSTFFSDRSLRDSLSKKAATLCDGLGAQRVVDRMYTHGK